MKQPQKHVLVRTYSAGVFVGQLASRKGKEVTLRQAIRIWHWTGAASLSQLAMEGTSSPSTCRFAVPVTKIVLTEAIEIIAMTKAATTNILQVKPWRA